MASFETISETVIPQGADKIVEFTKFKGIQL